MKKTSLALALAGAFAAPAFAQQATVEQKLQILQQEIDELKAQAGRRTPAAQPPSDRPSSADYASPLDRSTGLAGGATNLVGYGEANYNRFLKGDRESKADLRRFVFGLNHRFDERLTFHSEVEVEHGVVSKDDGGELELEQAWLNYRFGDGVNVKAGLFLVPLGILNETHEPPTYYGVERNEVETRIIPTTWRELGVGVHGALAGGLRYDAGVTTGFDAGKIDDPGTGIRSGHQEGQNANAHDLSVYGALNYRAPGVLVGGGVFSGDTGQNGQSNPLLKGVKARLTLWDVHAQYRVGRADLQALYAAGTLRDTSSINAANLGSAEPFAAPRSLKGAYVQAAYHAYQQGNFDVAPFVRLERFDIRQDEDAANGLFQDPNIRNERVRTVGVNFRVHPQVVIKADVQRYHNDKGRDRFDLGIGYMF